MNPDLPMTESGRACTAEGKQNHPPDVIVVLGGGIDAQGQLAMQSLQRAEFAARLYRRYSQTPIVVSGRWGAGMADALPKTEAAAMGEKLRARGVPDALIHLEESSVDTPSNAYCTAIQWLVPQGWKRLILVTSDYHIGRALYTFTHALGPDYTVTPCPAPCVLFGSEREERDRLEVQYQASTEALFGGLRAGDLYALRPRIQTRHAQLENIP